MMEQTIDFLEQHVNGKTLYTEELVYKLEDGALEGVYSDQISFSNLKHSQSGFQFDMFIVSNEKIYEGSSKQERKCLRKDFSSVSLFRFELAKRKSTEQITGFFRFISASGKEIPAEAVASAIYAVELHENTLTFQENQYLYRDQPISGERFKPVAFQAEHRFWVFDEKLHYEYDGESFDVNPATMQRSKSGDKFPPFCSVEKG